MAYVEQVVEVSTGEIIDGDLGALGSVCYISCSDGVCSLIADNEDWFSWKLSESPHVRQARWVSNDQIALWSFSLPGDLKNSVRAFTKSGSVEITIGQPRDIVFGHKIIFAGYGEQSYLVASDDEVEANLIAAFDENGKFLFGLRDNLKIGGLDGAIEMGLGCITEDNEGLFLFYPGRDLWRVSPVNGIVERIAFSANVQGIAALSATKDKIFFARKMVSYLVLGYLNTKSGAVEEQCKISYSSLGALGTDGRGHFRIHGCANGTILLTTSTKIWRIRFS